MILNSDHSGELLVHYLKMNLKIQSFGNSYFCVCTFLFQIALPIAGWLSGWPGPGPGRLGLRPVGRQRLEEAFPDPGPGTRGPETRLAWHGLARIGSAWLGPAWPLRFPPGIGQLGSLTGKPRAQTPNPRRRESPARKRPARADGEVPRAIA